METGYDNGYNQGFFDATNCYDYAPPEPCDEDYAQGYHDGYSNGRQTEEINQFYGDQ